jgi:hypothetical protein
VAGGKGTPRNGSVGGFGPHYQIVRPGRPFDGGMRNSPEQENATPGQLAHAAMRPTAGPSQGDHKKRNRLANGQHSEAQQELAIVECPRGWMD